MSDLPFGLRLCDSVSHSCWNSKLRSTQVASHWQGPHKTVLSLSLLLLEGFLGAHCSNRHHQARIARIKLTFLQEYPPSEEMNTSGLVVCRFLAGWAETKRPLCLFARQLQVILQIYISQHGKICFKGGASTKSWLLRWLIQKAEGEDRKEKPKHYNVRGLLKLFGGWGSG